METGKLLITREKGKIGTASPSNRLDNREENQNTISRSIQHMYEMENCIQEHAEELSSQNKITAKNERRRKNNGGLHHEVDGASEDV